MTQRLRIGMIGAGWVTGYHLPGWAAQSERAVVTAICDPDPEAAGNRAREFGIPRTFADAATMLAAGDLDAVDICAPREVHAEMVRLAAARGLSIICQKPLAPDLASAQALVADIGERVPLMVHENWRFRRWYRQLRDWLDQDRAGEIRQVRLDVLSSGMLAGDDGRRPALVRQPFLAGLSRMLVAEILIHHLDTLRFLLGELSVDNARLWRSCDALRGEDIASIALSRRSDGIPVTVTANLATPGAPALPQDSLRLIGSRATIHLDGARLLLEGPVRDERIFDADSGYRGSYAAAIAHFLDRLPSGRFETGAVDNLKTLELVESVYRLDAERTAEGAQR